MGHGSNAINSDYFVPARRPWFLYANTHERNQGFLEETEKLQDKPRASCAKKSMFRILWGHVRSQFSGVP